MLQQLLIKNIALIEDITIDFNNGFNVLTGETGTGKSIIIDALNLVLGERADKELVRNGTYKARVEGVFSIENNKLISNLLDENDIDNEEDMLFIVREISSEGKSVSRINGSLVTLATLKKIADKLADIHGQHEHQLLLNPENHLDFLDGFGGREILQQKDNVRIAYTYYKSCLDKLNGDWGTPEERSDKIEMLEFQINEIEKAEIVIGQEEELLKKAELLKNFDKIKDTLIETSALIGGNALDEIRSGCATFSKISSINDEYSLLHQRLESAFYEIDDISSEIKSIASGVEADPFELEKIEDRLALIKKMYRKYGNSEEEVLKFYDDACEKLDNLINAEQIIEELEKQTEQFRVEYFKQADKLSEIRHDVAINFEDRIKNELSELGMKNACFEVDFTDTKNISPSGYDDVEFLFSANVGEPVRPLSKIISGGELSRFMLALKSIASSDQMLQTMVFDEIDTGISGNAAQVVAQKIAKISKNNQVIAITHLPQIASMADTHFLIKKVSSGDRTKTEISIIDSNDRKREIARLAGGNETILALDRANEIIKSANDFKNSI
ncbi:MAG: DNA repair protein RecN [Clostridiales bacterium]|nr:DNA repair protein RecN [Clostridiales bacterium]